MKTTKFLVLPLAGLGLASCSKDSKDNAPDTSKQFTVTVENVSTEQLIPTMRANGTVPLSPGVFTVTAGSNPMFTAGSPADQGTERIAEDGTPAVKFAAVKTNSAVTASGVFEKDNGGGPILKGGISTFSFRAKPGDKLQLETMFVQSNDWFISLGADGLPLFNGSTPNTGNKSSTLVIYDAGTEADTAPGTGPDQKPVQKADNTGPPDAVTTIQNAVSRHSVPPSSFTIPPVTSVMKITVSAQ